ncbi:MAG: iron donor protein CyaY [Burkholderiaceae bacterium]
MTEQEFLALAERTLRSIEDALDACDAPVETSLSGPVLELEFDDGGKIIVNGNAPLREIWVAAKSGGFHFRREADRWLDTRSGDELFQSLSRLVSQQGGRPVVLGDA